MDATIKYTAAKNIPGLPLFSDFEKVFDTLEWPFIQKILDTLSLIRPLLIGLNIFITTSEAVF